MRASSGRRATPKRLSGRRATWPPASTSSTVRSTGVESGFSFGFGGGFGAGGGFFDESALVESRLVVSRAARAAGLSLVTASEKYSALLSPTPHADRTESGTDTVYDAGFAIFVVSLPATWLFQPSHTPL